MISPATLASAIVSKLQAIPELLSLLRDDESLISSYEDDYPGSVTFIEIVLKQPNPSVVVLWNGTSTGNYKRGEAWTHRFSLLCKTQNAYAALWMAIADGTPSSSLDDGQPFRRTSVHSSCDIIGGLSCDRRQLFISEFSSIDYFEISFTLAERGADR